MARCIAGLERLPTGYCVIEGEVWQDEITFRPPHLRAIGYVFKESCLVPHWSVRRNLLYGPPKSEPKPITFDEVVELLGLAAAARPRASAALRRRAAARCHRPRAIVPAQSACHVQPLATLDRCAKREILKVHER